MTDNTSQPPSIEAWPIPEGAVLLDEPNTSSWRGLSIIALRQILKERDLNLPLNAQLDIKQPERIFSFNRFAVQLATSGITSDEIIVPLNQWYRRGSAPQLLLAAQVDDENNVVYFPGVLTGPEFEALLAKRRNKTEEISLSLNDFHGGIDRLLSFVRILEPASIPRQGLSNDVSESWSWSSITKKAKAALAVATVAAGTILIGPEIFKPRLIGNLASITLSQVDVPIYTRGSVAASTLKVCLLSPTILNRDTGSHPVALVKFDQPLILSTIPLNKIQISKGGKTLWQKVGTYENRIEGPIPWPIAPIKPGEKYLLSIRPIGSSLGEDAKIILQAKPKEDLQKLNALINSLATNEGQWIKTINQKLGSDQGLALTLMFSNQAPPSKVLNRAKSLILEKKGCGPSQ